MRRINQLIFDEVIGTQVGGVDVVYYTSQSLNGLLGQYDQLGLQAIADDATGGSTLGIEVRLQTSCDGRNWVFKNSGAEIPLTTVSAAGTTVLPYGQDDGTRPSYAFVRFAIRLNGRTGAGSVHLRLYVTAREQGGVIERALFKATVYQAVVPKTETKDPDPKKMYQDCLKAYHSVEYCVDLAY